MKAILLSSLSLFLLLPACGKSGGVTGTWVLDTSAMKKKLQDRLAKENEKDPKKASMAKVFMKQMIASLDKMEARLVLKGGGTFTMATGRGGSGSTQEGKGTWKLEKNILTLVPTSGKNAGAKAEPLQFRVEGSALVPADGEKGGGRFGMIFRKQ